jgi:DNA-binding transcriptional regulator LsrR (DeoR family)
MTKTQEMREKIIAFLQGKENVHKSDIKKHLGLDEMSYNQMLEDALRSRRIRVTKAHPHVGTLGNRQLYLATPIKLYSPA